MIVLHTLGALALLSSLSVSIAPSQESRPVQTQEPIGLFDLIDEDAEVLPVLRAFGYCDGPTIAPDGTMLISDSRSGQVLLVNPEAEDPDENTEDVISYLPMAGKPQDLMFDAGGNLFICQAALRRIAFLTAGGEPRVVASRYKGMKLNSPANMIMDSHGGVYFTDPRYGRMDDMEMPEFLMAVFYLEPSGKLTRVIPSETDSRLERPRIPKLSRPNGIALSPDGSSLYVGNTDDLTIWDYPVREPGVVESPKLIYRGVREDSQGLRLDYAGPDSLVVDELGNIWAAFRVLVVFNPDGDQLGRIPVPELPTDMTWGGKDGTTLFITARNTLYKLETKVHGLPLPKAYERKYVDRKGNVRELNGGGPDTPTPGDDTDHGQDGDH